VNDWVFDRVSLLLPLSSRLKFDSPEPVVVYPKSCSEFGVAFLMIVIEPRWTFVKVHLTVSPGSRWKFAVAPV
jgi:hypothetical protein